MYFTPLHVCGIKGALKPNQEKARRVRAPRRGRCWGLGKRLCPRHLVHRRGCRTPGTRAHPSRLPVPLSPGPGKVKAGGTAVAAGWVWGTESRTSSRAQHSVAAEGLS